MKAKVIAARDSLPQIARNYSGKVGKIVPPPPGRQIPVVYWLKFADDKIAWFYQGEVELIIENEPPPKTILIPIGEDDGDDLSPDTITDGVIVWLKLINPEADCEVIFYG